MPAEERDQLYRERFDQIDSNHNGELDPEERSAWREKQREHYRQQAAERAAPRRAAMKGVCRAGPASPANVSRKPPRPSGEAPGPP